MPFGASYWTKWFQTWHGWTWGVPEPSFEGPNYVWWTWGPNFDMKEVKTSPFLTRFWSKTDQKWSKTTLGCTWSVNLTFSGVTTYVEGLLGTKLCQRKILNPTLASTHPIHPIHPSSQQNIQTFRSNIQRKWFKNSQNFQLFDLNF